MRSYASLRSDSTPHSSLKTFFVNVITTFYAPSLLRRFAPQSFSRLRRLLSGVPLHRLRASQAQPFAMEPLPSAWAFGPWGLLRSPLVPNSSPLASSRFVGYRIDSCLLRLQASYLGLSLSRHSSTVSRSLV